MIIKYGINTYDLKTFINDNNVSYYNKVNTILPLLNKNQKILWAIMCAESVKHIFNNRYPDNKCLDDMFNYLHSIRDFTNLTDEQRTEIKRHRTIVRAAYAYAAYVAYA